MNSILKRNSVVIAIAVAIIIVGFTVEKIISNHGYKTSLIQQEEMIESEKNYDEKDILDLQDNSEDIEEEEVSNTEDKQIYVYITGEVNNKGVVILNEGSRIIDAIDAAGGLTGKANISKMNLAYVLYDGMKINIPNDDDIKDNSDFKYVINGSSDNEQEYSDIERESNVTDNKTFIKNNSLVNINTASQTELETLPGIGPSLALRIVNYRKENGKFSSIDEIKNVSGIGDNKFEDLKKYITV